MLKEISSKSPRPDSQGFPINSSRKLALSLEGQILKDSHQFIEEISSKPPRPDFQGFPIKSLRKWPLSLEGHIL